MCVHMGIETVGILAHIKNRPRQAHTYGDESIYMCGLFTFKNIFFIFK